ncbi:cobalt-zinc-cadmium resistance protein CzcA [Photobacterium aphoticum]|uniref:Cobalt-zinc-cadmium resistance protein CzcA n=1 Tax=Photobacterium aphoticum TaxID=754436 RepID=A0A090QKG6_9GAMM|nr:cobalt-zinc-cadmium resistance protein CzcA [Photobacterium aphoticum]
MPGPAGEFVGAIAITVCFSLLGSYLISHTLVAGFAARWLLDTTQGDKASEAKNTRWYQSGIKIPMISRRFEGSIALAIKHPFLTALIACALPFAGFWGAGQLTEQFFPPSDRDMFEIQLFLPPQASIYATTQATQEVDAIMAEFEDVEQISWLVGSNYPSFYYNLLSRQQGTPNFAQAMVKVRDFEAANRLIPVLQQQLDTRLPQAQILVRKLEQGPPFNAPLEVRVYGPNLDQLKTIGEEIRLIMHKHRMSLIPVRRCNPARLKYMLTSMKRPAI